MKQITKLLFIVLLVFSLVGLYACGRKSSEAPEGDANISPSYSEKIDDVSIDNSELPTSSGQLIVYNYYYSLQSKDFEKDIDSINEIIRSLGGYTQSNRMSYDSTTGKPDYAYFMFRVPSNKLDSLSKSINDSFKVIGKNLDSKNITEEYVSNEARIQVLESSRLAYLKILENESLSYAEIIQITDKINNIDTELMRLQLMQNRYDNELEYSYVEVRFYEGNKVTVSFFDEYVDYLGDFFVGLFKVILYSLPVIVVLGGISCAIVIPIAKSSRKKKANKVN